MEDLLDIIQHRQTSRTFDGRKVTGKTRKELQSFIDEHSDGPFGSEVRVKLMDTSNAGKLGTYGVIKGSHTFIVGSVKQGELCYEDHGYVLQKILLKVYDIGLAGCWLGGTYSKSVFADRMKLRKKEVLPAVIAIGKPTTGPNIANKVLRTACGSDNRKPWSKLFFNGSMNTPLTKKHAGKYRKVLDAVRLTPSALNFQPWRVIKKKDAYHFYLKPSLQVSPLYKMLQHVDLGISICHFDLSASQLKLEGKWLTKDPGLCELEYIATWKEKE